MVSPRKQIEQEIEEIDGKLAMFDRKRVELTKRREELQVALRVLLNLPGQGPRVDPEEEGEELDWAKLSAPVAAEIVLSEHGKPMHFRDIADIAIARGNANSRDTFRRGMGKNPDRFEKLEEDGMYRLKQKPE